MALTEDRLDCGRDVADLVEQVADGHATGRDEHQAGCPHCQAALTEIALHWSPVRDAVIEPVPVPAGLLAAITARVRTLAGTGRYAVRQTERGVTRIATWVLERAVARATARVPGVSGVVGRVVTVLANASGRPLVSVQVSLTGRYGAPLPAVAEAVRDAVRAAVGVDVEIDRIDVDIEDIE